MVKGNGYDTSRRFGCIKREVKLRLTFGNKIQKNEKNEGKKEGNSRFLLLYSRISYTVYLYMQRTLLHKSLLQ